MAEYIFRIDGVLYNEETSEAVMKPELVGELIRCEDCKWWGRKDTYKDGTEMTVCKKGRSVIPEGFCHLAELRGEQE